jgi:hypothetical protein
MRLGIMQPYFLPYIGYFQLIAAVDTFIVYDNIKYTKKGWVNRNRLLVNGSDTIFSLPLKRGADSLDVAQRELAASFDRQKLLNQFRGAYGCAPQFDQVYPVLERVIQHSEVNLFGYIYHSIMQFCEYLEIKTKIEISSGMAIDHTVKGQDKVLALCRATGATTYINAIGGTGLYAKDSFRNEGVNLRFLKAKPFVYSQFSAAFVPWLSIVDVLMFNPLNKVRACINENYELI